MSTQTGNMSKREKNFMTIFPIVCGSIFGVIFISLLFQPTKTDSEFLIKFVVEMIGFLVVTMCGMLAYSVHTQEAQNPKESAKE